MFTGVTRDDSQAVTILAELDPMTRRIYGPAPFLSDDPEPPQALREEARGVRHRLPAFRSAKSIAPTPTGHVLGRGAVLTHHYHEDGRPWVLVPYQVELDNGLCVYATEDCDDYIREWHAPGPIAGPSEGDAIITVPQGAGATLDLMSTGGRLFSIPVPAGLGAGERFRVSVDSARNSVFCALLSGVPVMNCGTPLSFLVKKGR